MFSYKKSNIFSNIRYEHIQNDAENIVRVYMDYGSENRCFYSIHLANFIPGNITVYYKSCVPNHEIEEMYHECFKELCKIDEVPEVYTCNARLKRIRGKRMSNLQVNFLKTRIKDFLGRVEPSTIQFLKKYEEFEDSELYYYFHNSYQINFGTLPYIEVVNTIRETLKEYFKVSR